MKSYIENFFFCKWIFGVMVIVWIVLFTRRNYRWSCRYKFKGDNGMFTENYYQNKVCFGLLGVFCLNQQDSEFIEN